MTCDSVRELIQPLVDQELDLAQKLEIEAHLRSCVGCAEFLHELTELRKAIREKAPRYQAPEQLARRVKTALRAAAKAEVRPSAPWAWLAAAASLGFAAAILWGVIVLRSSGGSQQDLLAQELVSSHVRSLMPGHLVDVPTSDQHTVKPWFSGKLDFSPDVKDLTDQGFRLTGGRLDYLNQRAVAALAYQRRQHIINLFIWPVGDKAGGGAAAFARNGFNIVHWTSSGLEYWAVSDLNAAELQDFAHIYEK